MCNYVYNIIIMDIYELSRLTKFVTLHAIKFHHVLSVSNSQTPHTHLIVIILLCMIGRQTLPIYNFLKLRKCILNILFRNVCLYNHWFLTYYYFKLLMIIKASIKHPQIITWTKFTGFFRQNELLQNGEELSAAKVRPAVKR